MQGHLELSDVQCQHGTCQTFLKQSLVDKKPTAKYCFKCWCIYHVKRIKRTAREIRTYPHYRSLKRMHIPLRGE